MDSIPKLNKDAPRCISSDFISGMRGSEKRDCEIAAPIDVIKIAVEKAIESFKTNRGD